MHRINQNNRHDKKTEPLKSPHHKETKEEGLDTKIKRT